MRRQYYRDSYGWVHQDRRAERSTSGGSGMPAGFFVTALMVLATIGAFASRIH